MRQLREVGDRVEQLVYTVEVLTRVGERVTHTGSLDMIARDLPAAMSCAESIINTNALNKYYEVGFPWEQQTTSRGELGSWKLDVKEGDLPRICYLFIINKEWIDYEEN